VAVIAAVVSQVAQLTPSAQVPEYLRLSQETNPGSATLGAIVGLVLFVAFFHWLGGKVDWRICVAVLLLLGVADYALKASLRDNQGWGPSTVSPGALVVGPLSRDGTGFG
jgi:hypothetical protein